MREAVGARVVRADASRLRRTLLRFSNRIQIFSHNRCIVHMKQTERTARNRHQDWCWVLLTAERISHHPIWVVSAMSGFPPGKRARTLMEFIYFYKFYSKFIYKIHDKLKKVLSEVEKVDLLKAFWAF